MNVRLQKVLAEAGVASRRAAERLIVTGHVSVNGSVVRELGTRVDPATDVVKCDGRVVKGLRKHYIVVNKPRGVVTSRQDPQGRRTVMDLLPREWSMVYPVGRLDFDTEGLLFLTNDGDFCLRVTHPRYGMRKRYLAVVEGRVTGETAQRMVEGVFHEGERLRAERAHVLDATASHSRVELELSEGRNREVRRLFESQGLRVLQLRRLQIGPIKLGELPSGRWRVLTPTEIRSVLQTAAVAGAPRGRPRGKSTKAQPGRTAYGRVQARTPKRGGAAPGVPRGVRSRDAT